VVREGASNFCKDENDSATQPKKPSGTPRRQKAQFCCPSAQAGHAAQPTILPQEEDEASEPALYKVRLHLPHAPAQPHDETQPAATFTFAGLTQIQKLTRGKESMLNALFIAFT